jgi:hypothetical protein
VLELLAIGPEVTKVICWCDPGTHYRSYQFLGSVGLQLSEDRNILTDINYGCEHHFKSRCDALFGTLSSWRSTAAKSQILSSIDDVVQVFHERNRIEYLNDIERASIHTEEFFPPKRASVKSWTLRSASAPAGVTTSYGWRFTLNDVRRASILGRGSNRLVCTGVTGVCSILSGLGGSATRTFSRRFSSLARPSQQTNVISTSDPSLDFSRRTWMAGGSRTEAASLKRLTTRQFRGGWRRSSTRCTRSTSMSPIRLEWAHHWLRSRPMRKLAGRGRAPRRRGVGWACAWRRMPELSQLSLPRTLLPRCFGVASPSSRLFPHDPPKGGAAARVGVYR